MKKQDNQLPKNILISYCGICCSICPIYRNKNCPGCDEPGNCKIAQCAEKKGLRYCFLCKEFPCKLFKKGFSWRDEKFGKAKNWKPYSKQYIELFKTVKKKSAEL